jgi:uncharacterized membrane protein YoaK (UPF0700 family)
MYRLDREEFLKFRLISLWSMLGFQSGFINAFGYLACGRFVSHVTGFGTQIGVSLAEDFWMAMEFMGFPLSFMFGAFVSGLITSARLERGLKPRYDIMTLAIPFVVLIIAILGYQNVFGQFGEGLIFQRDFGLLFALSFVCGAQNGCFATLTKGQIRTTHLTGISTDIGTDFARMWFGKLNPQEHEMAKRANITRMSTFVFFSLGSIVSVYTSRQFEYIALLVPVFTAVVAYISVRKISHYMDRVHRINEVKKEREHKFSSNNTVSV